MKPKKQPNGAKKLPKPYVFCHPDDGPIEVIVYMPTKRAALAKLKWEGLSYGEKVEAICITISQGNIFGTRCWGDADKQQKHAVGEVTRALLALTGEPSP